MNFIKKACSFTDKPSGTYLNVLENYYLQLVTMTFYELTAKKTSPLISAFCQSNKINFTPENFKISVAQPIFETPAFCDFFILIHGLNIAVSKDLNSCVEFFRQNSDKIFCSFQLPEEDFEELIKHLEILDKNLGTVFYPEKINGQDKNLTVIAKNRHAEDEKIITEIKNIQRILQNESPLPQNTLKIISDIRNEIDFQTLNEPINQLIQLFDSLEDILQTHPQEDIQDGYETLLEDCRSFKDYIEQSLAMLGAEPIDEKNILYEPIKHIIRNGVRPLRGKSKVSEILRVGFIYKGRVLRKAVVEIEEVNHEDRN